MGKLTHPCKTCRLCSNIICGEEILAPNVVAEFPPSQYWLVGKMCPVCIIAMDQLQTLRDSIYELRLTARVMEKITSHEIAYKPVGIVKSRPLLNILKQAPVTPNTFKFLVNNKVLLHRYIIPDRIANRLENFGFEFGQNSSFVRNSEFRRQLA